MESDSEACIRKLTLAVRSLVMGAEHYRRGLAGALGVGITELSVLDHLFVDGPLTPREIARRLNFTTGSTTAVVDRVEKTGYATRTANPDDRRSLIIALTSTGLQAISWAHEQLGVQLAEALAHASGADLDAFGQLLTHTGTALEEAGPLHAPDAGQALTRAG